MASNFENGGSGGLESGNDVVVTAGGGGSSWMPVEENFLNANFTTPAIGYSSNGLFLQSSTMPSLTDAFMTTAAIVFNETSFEANNTTTLTTRTESTDIAALFLAPDHFYLKNLHLRHSIPVTVILSLLAAVIAVVTVLGNLLVLVAFFVDRTLRQPGNYLIVSLAMADLLIGIFSMPLYTMYLLLDEHWPLGWISCDLWLSLDYTVCLVSQYTVFYITLDRFLVVKFTATYRLWLTTKRAKLIVAGIWVGSWLLFFPSITGWQFFVGERTVPPNNCYAQFMENPLFNTILVILYYWVTLFVISILYTFIYRKAWEMETRRKAEHKRAQMVHMKLAQAAITRLGAANSAAAAGSAAESAAKRKQSAPVLPAASETTDDDDNKSSTSSQSWSNRKIGNSKGFSNNAPGIKALSTSASLTGMASALPPPPPNPTPVREDGFDLGDDTFASHKFIRLESNANADMPLLNEKTKATVNQKKKSIFNRKKKSTSGKPNLRTETRSQPMFTKAKSSPPEERLIVTTEMDHGDATRVTLMTAEESRSSPSKDDLAQVEPAPVVPMRRSYSDLEPVLTVSGLLRVPVDELIGIEFIDDEGVPSSSNQDTPESCPATRQLTFNPFSGNAIYRLRLDATLTKKSTTFENLPSARNEKTIRKRIDQLIKRTRQGVSYTCYLTGSLLRNKNRTAGRSQLNRRSENSSGEITDSRLMDQPSDTMTSSKPSTFAKLTRIAKAVRHNNHKNNGGKASSSINYQSRAHKALRMISFILGVFVITWTPYHIFAIMKGFCNECVNDTLYAVSYWFCYLNSPISKFSIISVNSIAYIPYYFNTQDPICYAVANKHFKRAFSKILHGNFKRT